MEPLDSMITTVRPARPTPSDAAAIHELISRLASYEREPQAVVVTPEEILEQLDQVPAPFECLLAEADDSVVGFALFFHNYSTWLGRRGLYVEDIFVPEHLRGRGIGTQLLGEVAKLALERECGRVEWSVLNWNTPSIEFYRRIGAVPMSGWTTFRLAGDALRAMASRKPR